MIARSERRRSRPCQEGSDAAEKQENITARLSDGEVRRIARAVAPMVVAQIAAALTRSADQSRVYSTRRGEAPPEYSREAWRDLARRIGVKRGRYYVVSAAELEAHERGDRDAKPANDAPAPSEPWHPRMAARALGLRPVGGAR